MEKSAIGAAISLTFINSVQKLYTNWSQTCTNLGGKEWKNNNFHHKVIYPLMQEIIQEVNSNDGSSFLPPGRASPPSLYTIDRWKRGTKIPHIVFPP